MKITSCNINGIVDEIHTELVRLTSHTINTNIYEAHTVFIFYIEEFEYVIAFGNNFIVRHKNNMVSGILEELLRMRREKEICKYPKDNITKDSLKKEILKMTSYIEDNKRTFTGEEINYYKGQLDMLHYLYVKYF